VVPINKYLKKYYVNMKFTELQNTFICLEALKVRVKEKEKENKLLQISYQVNSIQLENSRR
jgi:hypothetical protein